MTWIEWLVCAIVECAQEQAFQRLRWNTSRVMFWYARYEWQFSEERERWLRQQ